MSAKTVLVTGSLAYDFIMDFPGNFADNIDPKKLHIINLSFLVNTLKKEKGGTAGNIAYSLALLQTPVSILGTVGSDFDTYFEFLKQAGVGVKNIKVIKDEFTSQAFMTTDLKDNQISAFYPGAMKETPNLKIKDVSPKPAYIVISPNHPVAMVNFAKQAKALKIPYMFDPGMQLPRLSEKDLLIGIKGADILIGNDYEMELLRNKVLMSDEKLLENVRVLITTLGGKGAQIKTKTENMMISPAKAKKVVDPTGAGDAFRGGFLAGMFANKDLKTCGQMGAIASCYAIEKYGTTNHGYTIKEFIQKYKGNFKTSLTI